MVAAASLLLGCGGSYRAKAPPVDAPRGVAAAALPFAVLDGRDGHEVPAAELWARLRAARAVCAGEQHDSPHDHWMQLQVLDHLSTPAGPLGLGLEMVQQPFQGVLDDWSAARIDEAALRSRTAWAQRWGFDFALYRPMLELARDRHVAVVALNAPAELVKRVARVGVAGLDASERARLPQLDLADAQHRAWFDRMMATVGGGHGHGHASDEPDDDADDAPAESPPAPPPTMPKPDDIYAAQVVWDESMADGAARWLAAGPARRLLILAGVGHCHDSAIVRRLRRRGPATVVSVRPLIDDGEGNVAAALAEGLTDYLFVMTAPRPAH